MVLGVIVLAGCGQGYGDAELPPAKVADDPFFGKLPAHFPKPIVPADNPMTVAKVELGRHLFYDPRLSGNGTQSCSSCHLQAHAFTDGKPHPSGSTGQEHPRNAQSLTNVAYNTTYNWANPTLRRLEEQNLLPFTNTEPVELGVDDSNRAEVMGRLRDDTQYQQLFKAAFPGVADPYTLDNVVKALASFNRSLLSYRSPYDRYEAGDANAISDSAKRGLELFESQRLECNQCHAGFNFSDSTRVAGDELPAFHNTGLYNVTTVTSTSNYPEPNQGLYEFTGENGDKGRMRAPSLRNIALTAPYNHDGTTATLSDVIDNYARGGRMVSAPLANAGDGRRNRFKDGELHGFTLTDQEKLDLLAFLESLTDQAFIEDPSLSDPFKP